MTELEAARATIARLTAENEALRSSKQISDLAVTYWEDETRKARAAIATAKREGWIAGRDAAADCSKSNQQNCWECDGGYGITEAILALAPPATEGETDG